MNPHIQCQELTKRYSTEEGEILAVNRVDLAIARGDFTVILGHSGSGKTTLLSLIGGLTFPDQGTVLIDGVEVWRQGDRALAELRSRRIGFIFQFASLIPTLTVLENVILPLSFGAAAGSDRKLAKEILAEVGLGDKEKAFPAQLSGGQQRRVAIARAFVNQPEIILADEPTGDLDEETEQEILELFRRYNRRGITFVVVTHNRDLAATQDEARVLVMRQGVLSPAEALA